MPHSKDRCFFGLIVLSVFMLFPARSLDADTIYFKNGRSIEGIVKQETADTVEIDVGFGSIICSMGQVERVERSTSDETEAMSQRWEAKRLELRKNEEEYARSRDKRFDDYEAWVREESERKRLSAGGGGDILVRRDIGSGSILVDVVLNESVKATLLLDTGASVVVLTKKIAQELGINLSDPKLSLVTLNLAGNHKAQAKMVVLKSVKIGGVEVKDVLTAVLLEDTASSDFNDGLLGMTFLNKFNLKIDLKNMKMSLEKLKT